MKLNTAYDLLFECYIINELERFSVYINLVDGFEQSVIQYFYLKEVQFLRVIANYQIIIG